MPLAFPNVTGDVFALTSDQMEAGFKASAESPRLRIILPLHREQSARVQRMLNFFQPGTYVPPHRHPEDGAIETIQVLHGTLGFLVFDESGKVLQKYRLTNQLGLVDIMPGVWHGMVALEPNTVILEIKLGPYDATADKSFAAWAPEEGDPEAAPFVREAESWFA